MLVVGVQAYRSGFLPSELGHDSDEIEVGDDGTTLSEELASLDSRINELADAEIDCKWVGVQAQAGLRQTRIAADCPSTHPVLISGSGSCYNSQNGCNVDGQKVRYSRPRFDSVQGQYGNGWEIECDKRAASSCALPEAYAFCCSAPLTTNLPADSLPAQ